MTRKNLYNWYNNNDISYNEKNMLNKLGVDDSSYSSNTYPLANLKKLYHADVIFQSNKWSIGNDKAQTLILFSAEWNKDLVLVVHGDGSYGVKLLVYEMPSRNMSELLKVLNVSDSSYYSVSNANSRAYEVEGRLKGDKPIIYKSVYRTLNYPSSSYHMNTVFSDEVEQRNLWTGSVPYTSYSDMPFKKKFLEGFSSDRTYKYSNVSHLLASSYDNFLKYTDPDSIIKPLDIIKTTGGVDDIHSGIYLGSGRVYHNASGGIKLDDWKDFGVAVGHPNQMVRYHSIISFKNPSKIVEHIARCAEKQENGSWNFHIANNNCEHFVNKCVLGIDFSEHVEIKKPSKGYAQKQLNGSPTLESEINQTSYSIESGSYSPWNKVSQINSYKTYHDEGINMEAEARIEVRPQSWYKMGD